MISLSKSLTILLFAFLAVTVSVISFNQFQVSKNSYNSEIEYSLSRSPVVYDYSCNENDYQIHFIITNVGEKNVANLAASVTNPLCLGGNPILAKTLNASSSFSFYVQSTNPNGTLTISGNNTSVEVRF